MSMMIEVLHIRSSVSSGCSNVSAGRHPSRLIRTTSTVQCGYKSWGQDYEHIWSLRDTNKSFRHWILVAQQRTALPRSSLPAQASHQCQQQPLLWRQPMIFALEPPMFCSPASWKLITEAIWGWNVSAAALMATFKVWSECSNGVCLPAPAFRKKKITPVPDRRPLCLQFIDVDISLWYITVLMTSRAIFQT